MTMTQICMEIAKRNKKDQISIAQIREIVNIMSDLFFGTKTRQQIEKAMHQNGKRRFIKRVKGELR